MIKRSLLVFSACGLALIFLLAGAGVIFAQTSGGPSIPYTGRLTDEAGRAVPDGSYELKFALFDAKEDGTLLWSEIQNNVTVQDGSFAVLLGSVEPLPAMAKETHFWLEVSVRGPGESAFVALTPRQELSAASSTSLVSPVGGGLTCPHTHFSESWIGNSSLSGVNAGLKVQDIFTNGTGLYGEADIGIEAWGVGGYSDPGIGVNGGSDTGVGVRGYSYSGQGIYGSSTGGQGVYGQSVSKDGVAGTTGAIGMSGVYGYSNKGFGITGRTWSTYTVHSAVQGINSGNGYGGYFHSDNFRGLYASGAPGWYAAYIENPNGAPGAGLYVNGYTWVTGNLEVSGNLTVHGSKVGYVVDLAINDGPEPLETGDVVVITGYSDPVVGQTPLVKVRKAAQAGSKAVMGVVDQPYTVLTSQTGQEDQMPLGPSSATALKAEGTAIGEGQYLSVVTLGAFKAIKVDASTQPVQTGDLLVASANPGYAVASDDPKLGSVIGKALSECKSGTCIIPVVVTLK